eukprot:1137585-Pelagomonas_calceolata.AAC.7
MGAHFLKYPRVIDERIHKLLGSGSETTPVQPPTYLESRIHFLPLNSAVIYLTRSTSLHSECQELNQLTLEISCTCAALYPLDTIKTRLQAMIGGGGLKALLQSGGGKGLYAGAILLDLSSYECSSPSAVVTFFAGNLYSIQPWNFSL